MKKDFSQKGFVVLFTILISSLVLLMALGITSISTKEAALSIQSKDAARAFFAADTGMECALYQDRDIGLFTGSGPSFDCNGSAVSFTSIQDFPDYIFYTSAGTNNDSCVRVEIDKEYDPDQDGIFQTRITSYGYNTALNTNYDLLLEGWCGEYQQNERQVERGYRATY